MLGKLKSTPKRKHNQNKTSAPLSIDNFWEYEEALDSSLVDLNFESERTQRLASPEHKTIIDVLGNIPLAYNDSQAVMQYLSQVYQIIPEKGGRSSLRELREK